MDSLFKKPNEEKIESQAAIKLFLKLFSIMAAHFELKPGLNASDLASAYEEALSDMLYTDPGFVESLLSILESPSVKQQILEE